jgi:hypothetical protein
VRGAESLGGVVGSVSARVLELARPGVGLVNTAMKKATHATITQISPLSMSHRNWARSVRDL